MTRSCVIGRWRARLGVCYNPASVDPCTCDAELGFPWPFVSELLRSFDDRSGQ